MREMISNAVNIQTVDSPEQAPKYDGAEFTIVKIQNAIIVGKGTVKGNPTVDIQLVDEQGRKFLIMATAGIVEGLAGAVAGKRIRDTGN